MFTKLKKLTATLSDRVRRAWRSARNFAAGFRRRWGIAPRLRAAAQRLRAAAQRLRALIQQKIWRPALQSLPPGLVAWVSRRHARLAAALAPVFTPTVRRATLSGAMLFTGGALMLLSGAYLYFNPRVPLADSLLEVRLQTPLRIYTSDGVLIGEFGEQKRRPVPYQDIPPQMVQAFLAAEDDGFFSHGGVDIPALIRATAQLIVSRGEIRSGGGTITMQVARNYLLSRDKTFYRKFREIMLAFKLENRFSKQQLMEFYVNGVFFGNQAYGIAVAADTYYGRPLTELSLAEMALLVALPKAPSRLNPFRAPALAKARRNWILGRMYQLDYISQRQYEAAVAVPVRLTRGEEVAQLDALYAAEAARRQIVQAFGLRAYQDGYSVYTTIDSRFQRAAVQSLQWGLYEYDRRHGWRPPENLSELLQANTLERMKQGDFSDFEALDSLDSSGKLAGSDDVISALDKLSEYPRLSDFRPVLVLQVQPQVAKVLTADVRIEEIAWDRTALSWARSRREPENPDRLGFPPRSLEDLIQAGDLVYLHYRQGQPPLLTQLPEAEGAVVSVDPRDGALISMVGGFHFLRSKFNRVVQSRVQAGSVFKPFLYAAALGKGATPASIYSDAPVVFEDKQLEDIWRPGNASGRFYGPTRMREALVHSRNLVSIRLLRSLGLDWAYDYLVDVFEFPTEQIQKNLSMALGSALLNPMDVARSYSVFANGGWLVEPWLVNHVVDQRGRVVWRHVPSTAQARGQLLPRHTELGARSDAPADLNNRPLPVRGQTRPADQVMDARIAYQVTDMLREVMTRGTASEAGELGRADFSGKTGTTDDAQSVWFSGFNGQFVSVVWVGHDQPKSLGEQEFGATVALPIWMKYIGAMSVQLPMSPPLRPPGLVAVRINPQTGLRAGTDDKQTVFELFRRENAPRSVTEGPGVIDNLF